VDARVPAPRPDIALERRLLAVVEDVARRQQEDDDVIATQPPVGEDGGVLGGVDVDAVPRAEVSECLDGGRDRVVAEAGGLREEQDPELRRRSCRRPRPSAVSAAATASTRTAAARVVGTTETR
jgi:hypothetical protein